MVYEAPFLKTFVENGHILGGVRIDLFQTRPRSSGNPETLPQYPPLLSPNFKWFHQNILHFDFMKCFT